MKYLNLTISTLALCVLSVTAQADEAQEIKLKVADTFPTTHVISSHGIKYWMEEVEKLTDGQVTFSYYPAQQLGKAGSMLKVVRNRVADIVSNVPAYVGDRMILAAVSELPGTFETTYQGSQAFHQLILNNKEFEKLYAQNHVQPLWGALLGPYQISTKNKKVEKLEDFKGLKIRASGNTQQLLFEALGSSPISMPAPDTYVALQRGTIEGTSYMVPNWEAYSLQEEVKHSSTNASFGTTAFTYLINDKVWETLPDNVKEAMQKASEKTMKHFAKYMDEHFDKSVEKFKDMGIDTYKISDDELEKIYEKIQTPTFDDWKKKSTKKGFDAEGVLKEYQQLLKDSPLE